MNDITTQRGRLIDLAARADGFAPLRRATGAMVGTVYDGGAMPTSLPGQFLVRPTAVAGAESEGNAGTLSQAGARSAVVTVVGTKVPVVGDVLVARRQGARWVAQMGAGGPPTCVTPFCPDKPPVTLNATLNFGGGYTTSGSVTFDPVNHRWAGCLPGVTRPYRATSAAWVYLHCNGLAEVFYHGTFNPSNGCYEVANATCADTPNAAAPLMGSAFWAATGHTCAPFSVIFTYTDAGTGIISDCDIKFVGLLTTLTFSEP